MQNIYIKEKVSGRAAYQSFFTDAEEINNLMISLLGDVSGSNILEPCAGHGAFIKPLLASCANIHAIDIDSKHVKELKFIDSPKIKIQEGDFIDYFVSGPLTSPIALNDKYDAIICNPPYGLKFSVPYRKTIKSKFPNLYARESYGLFMVFGTRCLKNDGRFVFIVPDTFLTSRNHKSLREFLVQNTNITHLVQFDSGRFESINFGYGSLCILAGNRSANGQTDAVRWLDYRRTERPLSLKSFVEGETVAANRLKDATKYGWSQCEGAGLSPFDEAIPLGELAECRTGIYTGDNLRFCAYDEAKPPPRINGHAIDWEQVRNTDSLTEDERKVGIDSGPSYVCFVRGGHRPPYEKTRAAIDWSRDAVDYYRTDRKARLQNSQFYFQKGVAVPMVTSGRLSASYMEGAIFDQGVVGIFPRNEKLIPFLLVFLNSEHATQLKRKINPGANNSANYLKRIPVPVPNDVQIKEAIQICRRWKSIKVTNKEQIKLDASEFVARHFSPAKIAT